MMPIRFSKTFALFHFSTVLFLTNASHPLQNHLHPFHHGYSPRDLLEIEVLKHQPKISATWFADWHIDSSPTFTVLDIDWQNYDPVIYSFATITNTCRLSLNGDYLAKFVEQAHAHKKHPHAAVGGWTGSRYFSPCVSSPASRTALVKTITDFVALYRLDGLNFDWEYPNKQAIGCNEINPQDSENFRLFLQELRQNSKPGFIISAATGLTPFLDTSGNPMKDVSGFAKVLDYIMIMVYDIWGSWSSSVGPNAPLDDSCASPQNQQGSAVSAIRAWNNAGMPKDQIILGVASYGHSFSVHRSDAFVQGSATELASYPKFDKSEFPHGDSWDNDAGLDICGHDEPSSGNYNFWGLIKNGFLDQNGNCAKGNAYRFDECSQTPYVYNSETQTMISFDNAQSFCSKGTFIKENGLAGFAMWEAGGDSENILLRAIFGCMSA